jgi:hypothetical protein
MSILHSLSEVWGVYKNQEGIGIGTGARLSPKLVDCVICGYQLSVGCFLPESGINGISLS